MSLVTCFPGNSYDWSEWIQEWATTFGIKVGTKAKALRMLMGHIENWTMTPTDASKSRGLLQWADRGVTGRPCRGALTALTARQYWEHVRYHALTPELAEALYFLQEALTTMPDRKIKIGATEGSSQVMYTDASTLTKGGL